MPREKGKYWKPRAVFLLPNTFHTGDRYPNETDRTELEREGYGKCEFKDGLERAWTYDELVTQILRRFPRKESKLKQTGVLFAKLASRGQRKIEVHTFGRQETVADLELRHGTGILIVLQKPHDDVQVKLDHLTVSDIKIAHLNCQSLRNKIDELRLLLLCRTDIDVMTLSETWLKPGDSDTDFGVPGYTMMARRDGVLSAEDKARGGVLIYVRNTLVPLASKCTTPDEAGLEIVCIDLNVRGVQRLGGKPKVAGKADGCLKRKILRVVNVYIPPSTREQIKLIRKLKRSIELLKVTDQDGCASSDSPSKSISTKKQSCCCRVNYIILGDLNCDLKQVPGLTEMRSTDEEKRQRLQEFQDEHRLSQMITDFTRVRSRKERGKTSYITTETLIDLIYTDDHISIVSSGVIHIAMSDHYMVYCSWRIGSKKSLDSSPLINTTDEAFRCFTSQVKSDIDRKVFDLILARDLANSSRDWKEFERLRAEIERARKENKRVQKQIEKNSRQKSKQKAV